MKRSEINALVGDAHRFFGEMNFKLPPWANWSPEQWMSEKEHCGEIFRNQLGWDLTDFGSGDFHATGLLLFTIRNGHPEHDSKPYAEKIMIVEEDQVTPMHFHWNKMEDIINRGGGNLVIELYPSNKNGEPGIELITVSLDGIATELSAGDTVTLQPGESITLYQGLYHRFYGEPGKGKVLVGEVSAVNDDQSDNKFLEKDGRFPEIEEDADPQWLLVGDYQKYLS